MARHQYRSSSDRHMDGDKHLDSMAPGHLMLSLKVIYLGFYPQHRTLLNKAIPYGSTINRFFHKKEGSIFLEWCKLLIQKWFLYGLAIWIRATFDNIDQLLAQFFKEKYCIFPAVSQTLHCRQNLDRYPCKPEHGFMPLN